MEDNGTKNLFTEGNAKTLVIDSAVENCSVSAYFSKLDFVRQARLTLDESTVHEYIPEYANGTLSKEDAVDKVLEIAMNRGVWPTDSADCEYEVLYTENYPLYHTPAITVNYWSTDDSLGRWAAVCISLPSSKE